MPTPEELASVLNPSMSMSTTAAAPWDFWGSLQGLLGEDWSEFEKIKNYVSAPGRRWRAPRQAQDMVEYAQLMKDMGDEDAAMGFLQQIIGQGFNRPRIDLSSMMGPYVQRWGYGYGQPQASRAPTRSSAAGGMPWG